MLVELPNKPTFFSPMQTDPINIREKLFQGIDKEYNVSHFYHFCLNFVNFVLLLLHVTRGKFIAQFCPLNTEFCSIKITKPKNLFTGSKILKEKNIPVIRKKEHSVLEEVILELDSGCELWWRASSR